jgi:hypothetical protein
MSVAALPPYADLDEWTAAPAYASDAPIGHSNTVTAERRRPVRTDLAYHLCSVFEMIISITLCGRSVSWVVDFP